jgi:hypothetical protein
VRFKPGNEMRESVMKLGTPSTASDGQEQKQAPAA